MAEALTTLRTWLAARLPQQSDERGASLVEYALLVAFILVVCVIAVAALGTTINSGYSSAGSGFG